MEANAQIAEAPGETAEKGLGQARRELAENRYGLQGRAEALIRFLHGSHSGVMGLPLYETRALLRAAGYPLG